MNTATSTMEITPAQMPLATLEAPSFGSVSNTASTLIWNGKLPDTSASEMLLASSSEKLPLISALPPRIACLIAGAQYRCPSSTIASWRPTFSLVTRPNCSAPSVLNRSWILRWPNSSLAACACETPFPSIWARFSTK